MEQNQAGEEIAISRIVYEEADVGRHHVGLNGRQVVAQHLAVGE